MTREALQIIDRPRDYSVLGLEHNPFPHSPVPSSSPELYCGQEHVMGAISETVSTVLSTGASRHLVITGKYGNGKSHTLKYTRSNLRGRDDVIVGYVAQPGEGFLDIYREFMLDLGFDRVQRLAYEYLGSVANEETDAGPTGPTEMEELIDEGEVLLSELVPPTVQQLSDTTQFADFARAIVHMIHEGTNLYAWQWLTGEGIRYEQRKEMEIHSALDDDTTGVRAFTAFKKLLLDLGYTGIFVFVDEFESIARLTPKNEQTVLNSIRHLMDQNSHGLCLLFGCAPEIWQDVMSEYHAFSERIGQEVALRPMDEDRLRQLLSSYLETARQDGEGIEPFTDECLQPILQLSEGNVRQALSLCSRVVDRASNEDADRIERQLITEVMN